MLPDVGSTIVPPGLSRPSRSAASTIATAGRSFTDPPGFVVSILAMRSHVSPRPIRGSRTSGRVADEVEDRIRHVHLTGHRHRDGTLPPMQEHSFSIDVDAPPEEVWEVFWYRGDDRPKNKIGTIDILHPGDEVGNGLVRHCTFPVPRFLLSGGVGQSWEWLTEVKLHESWRYDAIGKPLWSRAEGFQRLEDLGDGRTRIHFTERYETFNPWMRRLGLERYVHNRLSRDNDTLLAAINGGIRWHRKRRARAEAGTGEGSGSSDRA